MQSWQTHARQPVKRNAVERRLVLMRREAGLGGSRFAIKAITTPFSGTRSGSSTRTMRRSARRRQPSPLGRFVAPRRNTCPHRVQTLRIAGVPPPTYSQRGPNGGPKAACRGAGVGKAFSAVAASPLAGRNRGVQPGRTSRPARNCRGRLHAGQPSRRPLALELEPPLLAELPPYGVRAPVTLGLGSGGASPSWHQRPRVA
jgi:hypothetical protein